MPPGLGGYLNIVRGAAGDRGGDLGGGDRDDDGDGNVDYAEVEGGREDGPGGGGGGDERDFGSREAVE